MMLALTEETRKKTRGGALLFLGCFVFMGRVMVVDSYVMQTTTAAAEE